MMPHQPQDEKSKRDGNSEGPIHPELLRDHSRCIAGLEVEKCGAED